MNDTRRLLRLLKALEAPCTNCENGSVNNAEAVQAWKQRLNDLVPPGSGLPDSYSMAGRRYYDELQSPPSELTACPECSGSGMALTEAGRSVAGFLARHGNGGAR